jgi:hypothetical protein
MPGAMVGLLSIRFAVSPADLMPNSGLGRLWIVGAVLGQFQFVEDRATSQAKRLFGPQPLYFRERFSYSCAFSAGKKWSKCKPSPRFANKNQP